MTAIDYKPIPTAEADPYSRQVTAEAIDFLYANVSMVMGGVVLMPIAMIFVMWGRVDHALLLAWSATVIAIILGRPLLVKAYYRIKPTPEDAPRWGRYFSLSALANGLAWGIAGIIFFTPDSAGALVFLYTCVIGLAAGSIIVYAYWLESYYAFIVPALSLCSLRLIAEGGEYLWLGLLLIMLAVILIKLGRKTSAAALAAIRLHYQNLALIDKLREEKEIAVAASRDKTRFLASASHDLRQPIHALNLYSGALHSEIGSDKARTMLASMGRSIEALNQLLGSLLDISKLDADIVKPNCLDFALRSLLTQLNEEYGPQARDKGLVWRVQVGDQVVHSDPVLLETILRNLISNAIRYTQEGGIAVLCRSGVGEVIIEIVDSGVGIPPEKHREIFREFFQLANPERDRSQGLGLGLSIVERMATLLGHRIALDSESGRGSRFSVTLKQGDAGALKENASHARPGIPGNWESLDLKVMVIDDEALVRESMRVALQDWGCEVILAGGEEEALAAMRNDEFPQVIIADYRLRDGKTGVEAIKRLRLEAGYEIPALIVTGDTHPERLREVQESGFRLMHKPAQPAQLRAYLRHVLRHEK